MRTRQSALLFVVVLAGCFGAGSPQATPTQEVDSPTSTQGNTPTPTQVGTIRTDLGTIRENLIDAVRAVETYTLAGTERSKGTRSVDRVVVRRAVNRTRNRSFEKRRHLNTAKGEDTSSPLIIRTYVSNGTWYQHSNGKRSGWTVRNSRWDLTEDVLARHRVILNRSELVPAGIVPVNGTRAYRIRTARNPQRMEAIYDSIYAGPRMGISSENHEVVNATLTFWISTETHRLLKVSGHRNVSLILPEVTAFDDLRFTYRYEYEKTVSITIPDAAKDATPAGSRGA